jgi:predicted DNA-binding transcriptional regulator
MDPPIGDWDDVHRAYRNLALFVNNLKDLWDAMRRKGIKLDKSFLEGPYKDVIEKGALEALRKGLFEYAMYTAEDPAKFLENISKSGFEEVGKLADAFKDNPNQSLLQKNATGGIVTSVNGGIAQIKQLPPGEGLASIGPGERIIPAGGGGGGPGGGVTVNVNGIGGADLANYLKAKIADAIYEYKRKEKFT